MCTRTVESRTVTFDHTNFKVLSDGVPQNPFCDQIKGRLPNRLAKIAGRLVDKPEKQHSGDNEILNAIPIVYDLCNKEGANFLAHIARSGAG
eukprot:m.160305 g.160305  ORF g.160305 m.160305 type:complete len:92 (-) comp14551_c0_seq1:124-399(-)